MSDERNPSPSDFYARPHAVDAEAPPFDADQLPIPPRTRRRRLMDWLRGDNVGHATSGSLMFVAVHRFRTFTIDYVTPMNPGQGTAMDVVLDEVVELFEKHGYSIESCSDQPTEHTLEPLIDAENAITRPKEKP